ncbi:MAG: GNAT family N-acetyltransferase [Synergistales bacterium]|nr:GNAT family N-acetyltransferase [Synergistales bacterium]
MPGIALKEYIETAASTEAFREEELLCLEEVMNAWEKDPDRDYTLLSCFEEGRLSGFLIYGKTPMTEHSYDLYWIVVSPCYQRQGIGRRLVREMEEDILRSAARGIIRIETSGKSAYEGQRHFYLSLGYGESGRIKDFYSDGDDLVTYSKMIQDLKGRKTSSGQGEILNCSE